MKILLNILTMLVYGSLCAVALIPVFGIKIALAVSIPFSIIATTLLLIESHLEAIRKMKEEEMDERIDKLYRNIAEEKKEAE